MNEVAAALAVFEEVLEELVQVVEEHAEAHKQLIEVAVEVVEAIFEGREEEYEADQSYESDRRSENSSDNNSGYLTPEDVEEKRRRSSFILQSSADEVVNESWFGDSSPGLDEVDGEAFDRHEETKDPVQHHQPEVRFLTNNGVLQKPNLESIVEESNSSTETVTFPNSAASETLLKRRVSDPQTCSVSGLQSRGTRRTASMMDFGNVKGSLKLMPQSCKASPAACAVSACSVRIAEPPKATPMYIHPGARYGMSGTERQTTMTAHTVRSDSGTFQVLWVEPPPSSSNSDVSLLPNSSSSPELLISGGNAELARTQSPMDKVKTKLAAWSWAKEHGLEVESGGTNWLPLLSLDEPGSHSASGDHTPQTDEPFAPPNSERPSGVSIAELSVPGSPVFQSSAIPDVEENEDDEPLELKVKATLSRPPTSHAYAGYMPTNDYLGVPIQQSRSTPSSPGGTRHASAISRQLSNLAAEDTHFKYHRDSVVLLHHRREEEGRMNQELMNSHDSVVLTRSKFDTRYTRSSGKLKPASSRMGNLSSIRDVSSPETSPQPRSKAKVRVVEAPKCTEHRCLGKSDEEGHSGEHKDCHICEVERPRRFEANCKKGTFM